MKITCPFCNNLFDDTVAVCPHCGAPNSNVRRKSGDQPLTIEELKQWYASKGLPPYETTRFFIGVNYTQPRAFGIYRDENTGNVVVYKNKADGSRAVRYEGTDEAYGVNEIFQRLKQEIIQQKAAQGKNKPADPAPPQKRTRGIKGILIGFLALFGVMLISVVVLSLVNNASAELPPQGYYSCLEEDYYFAHVDMTGDNGWYQYDSASQQWSDELDDDSVPRELAKKRRAAEHYITDTWSQALGVSDFWSSPSGEALLLRKADAENGYQVYTGYYDYGGYYYYHWSTDDDEDWFAYDADSQDWVSVEDDDIPDDLTHQSIAEDFYYTPQWDSSTQLTDFEDSAAYDTAVAEQAAEDAETDDDWDGNDFWEDDDDYDSSWDSDDSWDSDYSDWDSDW